MIALSIILSGLLVACLIGDYVIPHIPFVENYLENLPCCEDEPYDEPT